MFGGSMPPEESLHKMLHTVQLFMTKQMWPKGCLDAEAAALATIEILKTFLPMRPTVSSKMIFRTAEDLHTRIQFLACPMVSALKKNSAKNDGEDETHDAKEGEEEV